MLGDDGVDNHAHHSFFPQIEQREIVYVLQVSYHRVFFVSNHSTQKPSVFEDFFLRQFQQRPPIADPTEDLYSFVDQSDLQELGKDLDLKAFHEAIKDGPVVVALDFDEGLHFLEFLAVLQNTLLYFVEELLHCLLVDDHFVQALPKLLSSRTILHDFGLLLQQLGCELLVDCLLQVPKVVFGHEVMENHQVLCNCLEMSSNRINRDGRQVLVHVIIVLFLEIGGRLFLRVRKLSLFSISVGGKLFAFLVPLKSRLLNAWKQKREFLDQLFDSLVQHQVGEDFVQNALDGGVFDHMISEVQFPLGNEVDVAGSLEGKIGFIRAVL